MSNLMMGVRLSQLQSIFERGFNKRRRANRIVSVVMFIVAIFAVSYGLAEPSDPKSARLIAGAIFMFVICPIVFGLSFVKSGGLKALQTPEKIVWFYGVGRGGNVSDVMIGTEAGKLHKLPLRSVKEAPQALALLRQASPMATEGYSEQRRVQFKQQPQGLRSS